MAERYFIPSEIEITNPENIAVSWLDFGTYRFFPVCPIRNEENEFYDISNSGYLINSGNAVVANDQFLLLGNGCTVDSQSIKIAEVSRSIFDAPNFTPYEPIYFSLFLAISIFMIGLALKTIIGYGWK